MPVGGKEHSTDNTMDGWMEMGVPDLQARQSCAEKTGILQQQEEGWSRGGQNACTCMWTLYMHVDVVGAARDMMRDYM